MWLTRLRFMMGLCLSEHVLLGCFEKNNLFDKIGNGLCRYDERVQALNLHQTCTHTHTHIDYEKTDFENWMRTLDKSWWELKINTCLCLSAVRIPDAGVYMVGTAVFNTQNALTSPAVSHTSVLNTPAKEVEVNTQPHKHTEA